MTQVQSNSSHPSHPSHPSHSCDPPGDPDQEGRPRSPEACKEEVGKEEVGKEVVGKEVVGKEEIEKILYYLENMENIIRTTPNPRQKERILKDMELYRQRLQELLPSINPFKLTTGEIRQKLGIQFPKDTISPPEASSSLSDKGKDILDRLYLEKASPNCNNVEVNFIATVLHLIEIDYWPVISDIHCKLDFSHAAERDGLRNKLENLKRSLKSLVSTIEEYATAQRKDFQNQLQKVNIRQSRAFLVDANGFMQNLEAFLGNLVAQMEDSVSVVQNYKRVVKFDPRFEKATILAGKTIKEGIGQFHDLCKAVVQKLNLPDIQYSDMQYPDR